MRASNKDPETMTTDQIVNRYIDLSIEEERTGSYATSRAIALLTRDYPEIWELILQSRLDVAAEIRAGAA